MILVTGATGYIGEKLVKQLVAQGHAVRALVVENDHRRSCLAETPCEIVVGDITRRETLRDAMQGVKTVFHLAAVLVSHDPKLFHEINFEGTRNVVCAAVDAGVRHFVYISAAAAAYAQKTTYGFSKIASESLMKSQGETHFTIIRPTILFGDGGSQELKIYVEALRKFPLIIPVVGGGQSRKRPVWVGDIVKGLSLLVDRPVSFGKIYYFSGGTEISMWDFTKMMAQTFCIRKPLVPIPLGLCYAIAKLCFVFSSKPVLRKDTILGVTMDAAFDYTQAQQDIGYAPAQLEEVFERSFQNNPL